MGKNGGLPPTLASKGWVGSQDFHSYVEVMSHLSHSSLGLCQRGWEGIWGLLLPPEVMSHCPWTEVLVDAMCGALIKHLVFSQLGWYQRRPSRETEFPFTPGRSEAALPLPAGAVSEEACWNRRLKLDPNFSEENTDNVQNSIKNHASYQESWKSQLEWENTRNKRQLQNGINIGIIWHAFLKQPIIKMSQ